MATTDEFRTVGRVERGEGDSLLLWILVWSELAAFGVLLVAFLVVTLLDPAGTTDFRSHLHPGLAAATHASSF